MYSECLSLCFSVMMKNIVLTRLLVCTRVNKAVDIIWYIYICDGHQNRDNVTVNGEPSEGVQNCN